MALRSLITTLAGVIVLTGKLPIVQTISYFKKLLEYYMTLELYSRQISSQYVSRQS